ncbi:hypothetical protein ACQUW5_06365 [Legionella sp. CNM-1927-20]|uniref:hypothetical protein n=1 Tax=Legionella sp. CNM-1927-20 TaxID=3422221 RepID=UPI00403B2EA4
MPIHVFVGAGPANLHRALKVRKLDPSAQIIILDRHLNPKNHSLDREKSRANIFRFERDDVTDKLIADGLDKQALDKLIHERKFSVAQGFQQGDDSVFAAKSFSQIQIRDLQQILLDTLWQQDNIKLIAQNLNLNEPISEQVIDILKHLKLTDSDIQIHVATGALQGDAQRHEIIYPDKKTYQMENTTPDVEAMPVVPVHGTTTFFIKDQYNREIISCDTLERHQRSLDLTPWQEPLKKFGWNLVRPPRIRVFYANDILYIGAEIPISMMSIINKKEFEKKVADYTRKIAELVFPDLPIQDLKANDVLRSRFPTGRGESGQVISSATVDLPNQQKANITIFNNGDSRYLPHYQTGSGFVTGFLQNEIYAEIYQHQTLKDLFEWAKERNHIDKKKGFDQFKKQYEQLTDTQDETINLRVFQQELYVALTRDIIEENKKKVGRYFNALHQQTLTLMPKHFDEFFNEFKKHSLTPPVLPLKFTTEADKVVAILAMLKSDNIDFLRGILPRLLNDNISILTNNQLLSLRNAYLDDLKRNLPPAVIEKFYDFEHKSEFLIKLNKLNFNEILAKYNQIHRTNYQDSQFSEELRPIVIIEMLNRAETKKGIAFVRSMLAKLVENIAQYSDEDILAFRDQLTKDYVDYLDVDYMAKTIISRLNPNILYYPGPLFKTKNLSDDQILIRLIAVLSQENNAGLVKAITEHLALPLINKEEDQQTLGLRLAKALLTEKINNPIRGCSIEAELNKLVKCDNKEELVKKLKGIRETLTEHKELHHRAAFSFFKGKHSNTINEFVRALDKLTSTDLTKENLQLEALTLLLNFHDKLKASHSVRTLAVLTEAINNSRPEQIENPCMDFAI